MLARAAVADRAPAVPDHDNEMATGFVPDRGQAAPAKEKDPDNAFGPESVPLATGSASVVYWLPGPFPRPTPHPAG